MIQIVCVEEQLHLNHVLVDITVQHLTWVILVIPEIIVVLEAQSQILVR